MYFNLTYYISIMYVIIEYEKKFDILENINLILN